MASACLSDGRETSVRLNTADARRHFLCRQEVKSNELSMTVQFMDLTTVYEKRDFVSDEHLTR